MTWSNKGLRLVAPLAIAMPFLMGMRACGEDVPLGSECDSTACGPALGAPAITCWDGSTGGNTGHCIAQADGTCGWEFRDCPPAPDCTDAECGPAPLTPLPTHCERGDDMICHWVVDDPGACDVADCGPAPGTPTWTCADGTIGGFTGRCERDPATAMCVWEIVDCPMGGDCTVEECGPAPGSPACTCVDGSIGCNTGRCLRDAAGTCGWEWRECPTAVRCGGFTPTPVDCGAGYFCAYAVDDICGAADAPGTCQRRPDPSECAVIDSAPVCGCDGATYQNECYAWAAGTSAASSGACGGGGYDCDIRDVGCDSIPPSCPSGQVPTQSGICYGPCVPASSCAPIACAADSDCPASWACVSGTCAVR